VQLKSNLLLIQKHIYFIIYKNCYGSQIIFCNENFLILPTLSADIFFYRLAASYVTYRHVGFFITRRHGSFPRGLQREIRQ